MDAVPGTSTFQVTGDGYDAFMGRYSRTLAVPFADYCLPEPGSRFLDVGCGPGALTDVAIARLGEGAVIAVDPAPNFVDACRERHPGTQVQRAPAEYLPFDDDAFDAAAAQLVFHFVSDPDRAVAEMARVVRPSGMIGAAVWDLAGDMQMLRAFWDAALTCDPQAPDEARVLRFGGPGELAGLFRSGGLIDVEETTATVTGGYQDFDELWATFLLGIGPAGAYAVSRSPVDQDRLRSTFSRRLGNPAGAFELSAVARFARGVVPSQRLNRWRCSD